MNIMLLAMENDNNRMVGYVDHINAAGKLRALIKCQENLLLLQPTMAIDKKKKLEEATHKFEETDIQESVEDKRPLGAVIETEENKKKHINGPKKSLFWQKLLQLILKQLMPPIYLATNKS